MRNWRAKKLGLTLVETLLAMALMGLAVALVGPLAVQAAQTRKVAERHAALHADTQFLDQILKEDFDGLLPGDWKHQMPLTVTEGSTFLFEFVTLASTASGSKSSLHTPRKPSLVRYWKKMSADGGMFLEREQIDLTNPATAGVRERVAKDVESFGIRLRRRGEWADVSSFVAADWKELQAIRFRAAWKNGRTWSRTLVTGYGK